MREVTSIKTATLLNAAAKYTNVIFNLLATSILARILSPEDYGVVAVVTVFSTFFLLFADIGLGSGIIQNKDLNDDDISNIFSFTIYLGLALMVLFIPVSYTHLFLLNQDTDFVGTRLHGGMRAMQMGRRTIIIAIDNRATELQKDFGIPVIQESDIDQLDDMICGKWETRIELPTDNIRAFMEQFTY